MRITIERKNWLILTVLLLLVTLLMGCSDNKTSVTEQVTARPTVQALSQVNSSTTHNCEATGCTREGDEKITGISGKTEYYCTVHYNEMAGILSSMVKDVKSNTQKSTYTQKSTQPFTNKYGTATTRCAHTGCSNYIASSGDTNCCATHSNRCLECRCYIDEDAMYCVSCIAKALG